MDQALIIHAHLIIVAICLVAFLLLCIFDLVEITICRILAAVVMSLVPIANMMLAVTCFARIINTQIEKLYDKSL